MIMEGNSAMKQRTKAAIPTKVVSAKPVLKTTSKDAAKAIKKREVERRTQRIARRIIELREARQWSGSELARRAGINQQNVWDIEQGRTSRSKFLPEIAAALGLTIDDLIGETPVSQRTMPGSSAPVPMIPLIGAAAAGRWLEAPGAFDNNLSVERFLHPQWALAQQYAVRLEGSSMNKLIPDGALCICTPYATARPAPMTGDIVHAVRSRGQLEEWTVKRLRTRGSVLELWPESFDPRYQSPMTFNVGSLFQEDDKDVKLEIRGLVLTSHNDLVPR